MMLMIGVVMIFFSILFAGISFSLRTKKIRVIDKLTEYDESIEREVDARIANEVKRGPISKIASLLTQSSSKKRTISKAAKKYNQADFSMTYEEFVVVKFMGLVSVGFFVFAITRNFLIFLVLAHRKCDEFPELEDSVEILIFNPSFSNSNIKPLQS